MADSTGLTPAETRAVLLMRSLLGRLDIECGGASDAQIVEAVGAAYELTSAVRKASDAWHDLLGVWSLDLDPAGAVFWRGDGELGADDHRIGKALRDGPPPNLEPMTTAKDGGSAS